MQIGAPWICDTCGQRITSEEDGWVEWLNREKAQSQYSSHSLQLVHTRASSPKKTAHGCQHDEDYWFKNERATVGDLPLSSFLGPDGLMQLLEFASDGHFELDSVIEMIKRLHVPGYEIARLHFDAAISDGAFDPNTKPMFYWQSDISSTLDWLKRRGDE